MSKHKRNLFKEKYIQKSNNNYFKYIFIDSSLYNYNIIFQIQHITSRRILTQRLANELLFKFDKM